MEDQVEILTKLEAAKRQLSEAIILFFERRDPIAIHTLAAAAHQVLIDLGEHLRIPGMVKNIPIMPPEVRREWNRIVNEPHNFFKHADRDPDDTLEFRPGLTPFLIVDAVLIYHQIAGEMTDEQLVFAGWFAAQYPDYLKEGALKNAIRTALKLGADTNDFDSLLATIRHGLT